MEPEGAVYKTLLESTKAIPWRIEWSSQRFTYIGPQIEELLGWSRDSWQGVSDWAERMHPEDRERVLAFCVSQSQAGVDHEAGVGLPCARTYARRVGLLRTHVLGLEHEEAAEQEVDRGACGHTRERR